MVPPQARTAEQLLAEGKRLLEAGNKPGALAHLVMATNLAPDNETAWLLRAKAASDPQEAVDCLERALELNPKNTQAREELLDLRMHSLQAKVRGAGAAADGNASGTRAVLRRLADNRFVRLGVLVFLVIFCGLSALTLAGVFALMNNTSNTGAVASVRPTATPTSFQLPPTWTPSPTQPPTSTPIPSPTPSGIAKTSLTVRAGPGTNFARLGAVAQESEFTILGRSSDGKYLEIAFPDTGKPGWVIATSVDLGAVVMDNLEIVTPLPVTPVPVAPRPPVVVVPTVKPSATPLPRVDFAMGRPVQYIADCSQQWKLSGTVYTDQSGSQRLNGIQVRIWAFGQLQGTIGSGSVDYTRPGYWEWTFSRGSDVQGEIAIVNPDGTLRSQPIGYHLTPQCDGSGAVNQMIFDFVGLH